MVLFNLKKKFLQEQIKISERRKAAEVARIKKASAKNDEIAKLENELKAINKRANAKLTPSEKKYLIERKKRNKARVQKARKVFNSIMADVDKFVENKPKPRKRAKKRPMKRKKRK